MSAERNVPRVALDNTDDQTHTDRQTAENLEHQTIRRRKRIPIGIRSQETLKVLVDQMNGT